LAASTGGGGSANIIFLDTVAGLGFSPEWAITFTNGQWVHLAVVGTRTTASLYVDGGLVASQSGPAIGSTPQPTLLNVGRLTVPGFDAFQGNMDELRLYNRALSDSEIQQLHDYTPPPPVPPPSLHITLSGHVALVWWTTNASRFQLETSSQPGPNQNWTIFPGPVNVLGDLNVAVADATSGVNYFRLRRR
jgi:hypothetical protein